MQKAVREKYSALLSLCVLCVVMAGCLKSKDDPAPPPGGGNGGGNNTYDWPKIADSAQSSLEAFWSAGGQYYLLTNNATDWAFYWPNAHALDVLVDAYLRNPSSSIKNRMNNLVEGVKIKNGNTFINQYYDDMEWMALACLRAYKATTDTVFKNISLLLWNDIKKGWSADLGGGIWWRKDNPSKNAPSNAPAAILAARLYTAFGSNDDLQWAKQIYDWQKSTLYEPGTGLVYDNIDRNGAKNTTWKFTYNQGTFLGAALELNKATGNPFYLDDAIKAADYTLNSGQLTSGALLKNEGGGDGGLFKGIFVRYLTRLVVEGQLSTATKNSYLSFLKNNAQTLWSKGTNKAQLLFGSAWDSPAGNTNDLTVQLSGIMLFEAMAELKKLNLVN